MVHINALILSCGTRCLLVDYFMQRENGFDKVVAVDCSKYAPALYRADKHFIVPRMNDPEYLPTILEIAEKEEIDLVLPLQEDELLFISENQDAFRERKILPVISDRSVVELCRDKYRFSQKLTEWGIPAVPTFLSREIGRVKQEYGFPIYMKPRNGAGSVSNYVLDNDKMSFLAENDDETAYVIQPMIEGEEYGVNAYVDLVSGKTAELFILKKLRMRSGETEKSVSVHDETIKEMAEAVLEKMKFRGPVDIDVLKKDGRYYILEVNPRFGGAYPHTHSCGVNFIRLLSKNAAGTANPESVTDYEEGVTAFRYMSICTMKEDVL